MVQLCIVFALVCLCVYAPVRVNSGLSLQSGSRPKTRLASGMFSPFGSGVQMFFVCFGFFRTPRYSFVRLSPSGVSLCIYTPSLISVSGVGYNPLSPVFPLLTPVLRDFPLAPRSRFCLLALLFRLHNRTDCVSSRQQGFKCCAK